MEDCCGGISRNEGNIMDISDVPIFGVAGFPPTFTKSEFRKKRENIFAWLHSIGLGWIELQNTRGVKMKDDQALLYKQLATENDIGISLHASYYITLASGDEGVAKRSKEEFLRCFKLAEKINSKRIIFHPGFFPGNSTDDRKNAILKIVDGLNELRNELPDGVKIYPETADKRSQVGSLEEILEICELVDYAWPCIDVAHVHCFEGGTLTTSESIFGILDDIEKKLGSECLRQTHFHMCPIEVDSAKHKAFHDRIEYPQRSLFESDIVDKYYPLAEHFISAIKSKNIKPVIVCEAKDSQESGALLMKSVYYGADLL